MKRRESKWTSVYSGASLPNPWYIRLTPVFMDLEAAGFSHGLSISGNTFATREDAEKAADVYDKFFDAMAAAIVEDAQLDQKIAMMERANQIADPNIRLPLKYLLEK